MADSNEQEDENQQDQQDQQSDGEDQQDQQSNSEDQKPPPTWLAWSVRGLSLLLILSIVGYLVYSAAQEAVPPRFTYEIRHQDCAERDGRWVLPVKITNEGSSSAHDLTTSIVVDGPEGKSTQQITLPLIGPNEALVLEYWYDEDPRSLNPQATTVSYLLP